MEKRDINKTRQAIIAAAEELMAENSDPDKVTSRIIANRAGVNAAMINYCFGSREELLYTVFRGLLSKAQAARPELKELLDAEIPPSEKLIAVHIGIMKLMLEHFNYAQAITKYIIINRDLMTGMDSFALVKACFSGKKSDEECRLITFQLTSLHELSVLRHEELRRSCGTDLRDDAQLEAFVRRNIGRFLDIQEDYL